MQKQYFGQHFPYYPKKLQRQQILAQLLRFAGIFVFFPALPWVLSEYRILCFNQSLIYGAVTNIVKLSLDSSKKFWQVSSCCFFKDVIYFCTESALILLILKASFTISPTSYALVQNTSANSHNVILRLVLISLIYGSFLRSLPSQVILSENYLSSLNLVEISGVTCEHTMLLSPQSLEFSLISLEVFSRDP